MTRKLFTVMVGIVLFLTSISAFSQAFSPGNVAKDSGARAMVMMIGPSTDGDNIMIVDTDDTPFGNVTMYEDPLETPWDWAKTPEEYAGYVSNAANGVYYNSGNPYVLVDMGSKMTDWWPALNYYVVVEVNPAAYGGHHPTATKNYTCSSQAIWATDGEFYPGYNNLTAICDDIAVDGSGVITWTDMPDENGCIAGYNIYKNGAFLAQVLPGVGTYTDAAGAVGDRYNIQIEYNLGYKTWGRSPTVRILLADTEPPFTNVTSTGAYRNVSTFDITYLYNDSATGGSLVTDVSLWYSYDGGADTDSGIAAAPNAVGPGTGTWSTTGPWADGRYDFWSIGTDAIPNVELKPAAPDWSVVVDTLPPTGVITGGPGAGDGTPDISTTPFTFTYTYADNTTVSANVAGTTQAELYVWTPVSGGWVSGGIDATLDGSISYTPSDGLGLYYFYIVETDAAGNVQAAPAVTGDSQWTVSYQTSAPVTSVTSTGAYRNVDTFDVTYDYQDLGGLNVVNVSLYYSYDGAAFAYYSEQNPASPGPGSGTFASTGPWADGLYDWYTIGVNSLAAVESAPGVPDWSVVVDTRAPLGGATGGTPSPTSGSPFTITYTYPDDTTESLNVSGTNNSYLWVWTPLSGGWIPGPSEQSDGSIDYTPTDGYGLYLFYVQNEDYAGNVQTAPVLPGDAQYTINYVELDTYEIRWTVGWNLWSMPLIRSENATNGLEDHRFSWFASAHYNDTSKDSTFADNCSLVAYVSGAYITYIHPLDIGGPNDLVVTPDNGYWAYVEESWFTDEVTLSLPEQGVMVDGQYPSKIGPARSVSIDVGWNLIGWTSFNGSFSGSEVITLCTVSVSPSGIPQPEIVANWTATNWESGNTVDMQHWEGAKDYTTFLILGPSTSSPPNYDFPLGPGYAFWVYSETGGQTMIIPTT